MLHDVVKTMSNNQPVPSLDCQVVGIHIHADRARCGAIIGHLIRNAQDATPADGKVIVRLFRREDRAIIEVQDTGSGMDETFIKERLFRPFDSTKGKAGMGIGVYEARDYIHKHGGDLEVISRVNEGSTFRIRLPVSDPA
jgi:signal transduction histidine kinase